MTAPLVVCRLGAATLTGVIPSLLMMLRKAWGSGSKLTSISKINNTNENYMYIGNIYPHINISELIISLTSYQKYQDDSILVHKKLFIADLVILKQSECMQGFQNYFRSDSTIFRA